MTRSYKAQYFESEGRENLPLVIKCIKTYLRGIESQEIEAPKKVVFLTREGEGPMLAYNQLHSEDVTIIAVTFPKNYAGTRKDGSKFAPEIPEKVKKFFTGVGIPIITNRLPFDDILGAEGHNHEMSILRDSLALFGASVPLAIQAVLQATDAGYLDIGELVIAATGDTALLVTASTSRLFLLKNDLGFAVNEVICKPSVFSRSRKPAIPKLSSGSEGHLQLEGHLKPNNEE